MRKEVIVVAALSTTATVVVLAAVARKWKRRKENQWKQTQRILRKFARDCATPLPKLWQVANALVSDMEASLSSNSDTASNSLNMLVSYVASLPNGEEKGVFYGINLRATDFLILCARLSGKNEPISDLHREEISIPSNVMGDTSSQELFDYIAGETAKFVSSHPDNDDDTPAKAKKLGFILSYSVDQAVTPSASAIKWKNFAADHTVGETLVTNINRALAKHDLNMRVYALVDDSIGILAGGRFYNRDSVAAVTIGMGTNAAYVESSQTVPKWQGPTPESGEIVISTEWGNFSSSSFPVTLFDASLDTESSNPGSRIFEKLVSGMYLGDIVRRVLLIMAEETSLFGDDVPPKLKLPYLLRSPDMATMHQDTSEDREVVKEKLESIFEITDSTPNAREVVAEVCDIVAERGARLAAAGIVGIIKKLGRIELKKSVVNVEGGLYEHYRVFRNYLHSGVWEMLGNELSDNIIIEPSHEGSGAGALFLAASQTQNPQS